MAGFNTYSTEHGVKGYVVRTQQIVVCHSSYDSLLKGHNVHDEWNNHSPGKVHEFFDKIQDETTHPTLLSSPKWPAKPSWISPEDHGSPKYGEHHDWENSSGSPLRDSRRSHDDYPKPKFNIGYKTTSPLLSQATKILEEGTNPLSSPTAPQSHFPASYSAQQRRESFPERSQGGKPMAPISTQPSHYPTSNPITERKESYPDPTKGTKPLFSSVYTQQPHSPTSYPTSPSKENYPETKHDGKPQFSSGYVQQPHFPNAPSQNRENYPNKTQGVKPLYSPASQPKTHHPISHSTPEMKEGYPETAQGTKLMMFPGSAQQPHSPTSNPTPQNPDSQPIKKQGWKSPFSPGSKSQTQPTSYSTPESYPDHETQGRNPSFNPSPPKKEHFPPPITTPMEDYYSDYISPYEYTEKPHYGIRVPPKEGMDSREAKAKFGNLKPTSPTKMSYRRTINSIQAVNKYNGAFVPIKK